MEKKKVLFIHQRSIKSHLQNIGGEKNNLNPLELYSKKKKRVNRAEVPDHSFTVLSLLAVVVSCPKRVCKNDYVCQERL